MFLDAHLAKLHKDLKKTGRAAYADGTHEPPDAVESISLFLFIL